MYLGSKQAPRQSSSAGRGAQELATARDVPRRLSPADVLADAPFAPPYSESHVPSARGTPLLRGPLDTVQARERLYQGRDLRCARCDLS